MPTILGLVLLIVPGVALANAGLPMLLVVWPLSICAILPVIALESWVINRTLNVGWRTAIIQMTKANVLSTLVGIPLAWIASVALDYSLSYFVVEVIGSPFYPPRSLGDLGRTILSAPWLGGFSTGGHWRIPVATIALLVPCFFASFWSEAWYVARILSPTAPKEARRAVWNANLLSYIMLLTASITWLLAGVVSHA